MMALANHQAPTATLRYYQDVLELRRITIDPEVMGGKPCIRGMRVTVGMIVESISAGRTVADLLADFPYLEEDDIREALAAFAASVSFFCWMIRSIDCQCFGVQTVPLNPAVVVTVPGRSEMESSFRLSDSLDQGRSQVSQKWPCWVLCPLGLTLAPSRTVHHHM